MKAKVSRLPKNFTRAAETARQQNDFDQLEERAKTQFVRRQQQQRHSIGMSMQLKTE